MALDRLGKKGARGVLGAYVESRIAQGAVGAVALDLSLANNFDLTANGNVTLTFTNPPAAGTVQSFTVVFRQDGTGGRTLTLPASVKWPGGAAPSLSTGVGKVDVLNFTSFDGGATWIGAVVGLDVR